MDFGPAACKRKGWRLVPIRFVLTLEIDMHKCAADAAQDACRVLHDSQKLILMRQFE